MTDRADSGEPSSRQRDERAARLRAGARHAPSAADVTSDARPTSRQKTTRRGTIVGSAGGANIASRSRAYPDVTAVEADARLTSDSRTATIAVTTPAASRTSGTARS